MEADEKYRDTGRFHCVHWHPLLNIDVLACFHSYATTRSALFIGWRQYQRIFCGENACLDSLEQRGESGYVTVSWQMFSAIATSTHPTSSQYSPRRCLISDNISIRWLISLWSVRLNVIVSCTNQNWHLWERYRDQWWSFLQWFHFSRRSMSSRMVMISASYNTNCQSNFLSNILENGDFSRPLSRSYSQFSYESHSKQCNSLLCRILHRWRAFGVGELLIWWHNHCTCITA